MTFFIDTLSDTLSPDLLRVLFVHPLAGKGQAAFRAARGNRGPSIG